MNLKGWYNDKENFCIDRVELKHARKEKNKQEARCRKKAKKKSKFYSTQEWKRVRYQAFVRYGNICMCCGISREDGAVIQVDHIKPVHKYPELALDINNLQILCASCNRGKYGDDHEEDDWRTQAERHMKEIIHERHDFPMLIVTKK